MVFLFRTLAAKFSQTNDPTIAADAVDYGGRSQNYLFLAERWEGEYKKAIGADEEGVRAAFALSDTDIVFSHGEDMLFHPKRSR